MVGAKKIGKWIEKCYVGLVFFLLYAPILILIVCSFNNSKARTVWGGFTLHWYTDLFANEEVISAVQTSLGLTGTAALLATLLGTMAAIGMSAMSKKRQSAFLTVTNIPMLNADIVTGIAVMLLFVRIHELGYFSLLVGHVTIGTPYVILNVLPKLQQTSRTTYEAALDLGASPLYAFFKVVLPDILPGIFSGFLLAFTISLDDFVITYFTKGAGMNTISTMIYQQVRRGINPQMYALSTILFLVILLVLWTANRVSARQEEAQAPSGRRPRFHLFGLFLVILLGCTGCGGNTAEATESGDASDDNTLIVFNYGDYIDEQTIDMFEEETGITVEYEQYVTPEDMYTKYQSGAIPYDVICTSDYMVEKMIEAGEVKEIRTESMEYYDNLDPQYLEFCQAFDPENRYAVPYFWGTVGIIYNTELVDEEVTSWEILWDEKYKNQIVMENSMRDAFLVPLKLAGLSLNTTDEQALRTAQEALFDQKSLVMAYLVDETRDIMIAGDAALAVIYSGDATAAMEYNDALEYVLPKEGSNIWFDCWFIPDTCEHQENAEKFIDFMNREDVAAINFDYVYYGTPNQAVYDSLDEETKEDTTIFPAQETLEKCEVYQYLGSEMETLYTRMWKELKAK